MQGDDDTRVAAAVSTAISVIAAIAAAALFGAGSVLQQAAASSEEDAPLLRFELLVRLAHRRRWLQGIGMTAISFAVVAVALAFGPLALVQPIAATDLLFAMPLLARRRRTRLSSQEWTGAALVAGGIAAFLAISTPSAGRTAPEFVTWLPAVVAVGAVALVAALVAGRLEPGPRTGVLAAGAAAVFALLDALTKSLVGLLKAEGADVLLRWEPYALLAAGILGLVLSQSAFRSGSLLVSLPIIDALEPLGAVLIGATVFAERLARSPVLLGLQVLAGAIAIAGIVVLDRSPARTATAGAEGGD